MTDDQRCVVPNCTNSADGTTRIPFPEEPAEAKKWLESLRIPDFVLDSRSLVCSSHFGAQNTNEDLLMQALRGADNLKEELEKAEGTQNADAQITKTESCEYVTEEAKEFGTCRLCMGNIEVNVNVFEPFGETTIAIAIQQCIPLLKISEQDPLSKLICNWCLDQLSSYHTFRGTCLRMDAIQQRSILRKKVKRKLRKPNEDSDVSPNKRVVIRNATGDAGVLRNERINEKFDKVEAELMKALEGKLPEDLKSVDNIIFEVRSDDESEEPTSSSSQNRLKISEEPALPLGTPIRKPVVKMGPALVNRPSNVVKIGSDNVILPTDIKVIPHVKPQLVGGTFPSQQVKGFGDWEFCLVNNHLFEYRLFKGNYRSLSCIALKCHATARQNVVSPGVFENQVTVKSAHNHPTPSEEERKKQMFYHLMRRKMQTDKALNFRTVYDEVCEMHPEVKELVPLRFVINQICCHQLTAKLPPIQTFDQFYATVEEDVCQKLHFTHSSKQFYQEKFAASDGSKAVVFANSETIDKFADGNINIMYVDSSFKIETSEPFWYHLMTVLVWSEDSYYPILFALLSQKSKELFKCIFAHLHDVLAPTLRPEEIVTDYEASLYYALGEVYLNSHIGGSVFYYTQNLYKKICSLNLSRDLESNSSFRNIYHMILMLPLLPVNTIRDGLHNIELQASELGLSTLARPIFEYVRKQWIVRVTPELFCVHRLENRINENVIAPFKKLRDFLMLSKGKMQKQQITILSVVEKLIDLEGFLQSIYAAPSKKSFARDLSSSQKKNVIKAWQYIEAHPKININNFFTKVLGYIKCMENQLWIWGFYRYRGDARDEELINAANFSIINSVEEVEICNENSEGVISHMVDLVVEDTEGFLVNDIEEVPGDVEGVEVPEKKFQSVYMKYLNNDSSSE